MWPFLLVKLDVGQKAILHLVANRVLPANLN